MKPPVLQVLYEDNHLLAVVKPAGLATMGTPEGRPTLLSAAKDYIRERYHKPGNVYLGVVSRLDAPVTGVVLLARTSKAANRLTEQFRRTRSRSSIGRWSRAPWTRRRAAWWIGSAMTTGTGGCTSSALRSPGPARPGFRFVASPAAAGQTSLPAAIRVPRRPGKRPRSWRSPSKRAGSTRFGCNWPIAAIRS